jgi:hypothetical protein
VILLYRRLRYGYAFRRIPLTRGEYAIVDPADYEYLSKFNWHLAKSPSGSYAARWGRTINRKRRKIWMHRDVIDVPENLVCDHINGIRLDNRKANLRPATVSQNVCNSTRRKGKTRSKYKGLEWDKAQRKWKARIQVNRQKFYLGSFASEIDADRAYDKAAQKHHGKFAKPNFTDKNDNNS